MEKRSVVSVLLVIGLALVLVSLGITFARFSPALAASTGLLLGLCILQGLIVVCYATILKLKMDLGDAYLMDWVIPALWVICLILNSSNLYLKLTS